MTIAEALYEIDCMARCLFMIKTSLDRSPLRAHDASLRQDAAAYWIPAVSALCDLRSALCPASSGYVVAEQSKAPSFMRPRGASPE